MGLFRRKDKLTGREEMQACLREAVKECMEEYTERTFREGEKKLLAVVEDRLKATEETVGNLNKQVKRQSEAIEDLLDELQEKETAAAEYRNRLREKQEREEALVALIGEWQRQLEMLEERIYREPMENAEKQEAWRKQLGLLKEQITVKEKLCAIEEVGREGESVDYRIHEVIGAMDAEREDMAGTVAKVHSRGIVYEGKVVAKAKVEAYKR